MSSKKKKNTGTAESHMEASAVSHLPSSHQAPRGPLHGVWVWVTVLRVKSWWDRKSAHNGLLWDLDVIYIGHCAASRWQRLLVTADVGHFLTSNLEVKSSFSHYQVLEVVYMNRGKSTFWIIKHTLYISRFLLTQQMALLVSLCF